MNRSDTSSRVLRNTSLVLRQRLTPLNECSTRTRARASDWLRRFWVAVKSRLRGFFRLPDPDMVGVVTLKTGILIQDGFRRVPDLFMVSNFLIMRNPGIRLTAIGHAVGLPCGENQVLIRMRFFLATVVQGLVFRFFGRWRRRSVPSTMTV